MWQLQTVLQVGQEMTGRMGVCVVKWSVPCAPDTWGWRSPILYGIFLLHLEWTGSEIPSGGAAFLREGSEHNLESFFFVFPETDVNVPSSTIAVTTP